MLLIWVLPDPHIGVPPDSHIAFLSPSTGMPGLPNGHGHVGRWQPEDQMGALPAEHAGDAEEGDAVP